jgi:hypothetical protein
MFYYHISIQQGTTKMSLARESGPNPRMNLDDGPIAERYQKSDE